MGLGINIFVTWVCVLFASAFVGLFVTTQDITIETWTALFGLFVLVGGIITFGLLRRR